LGNRVSIEHEVPAQKVEEHRTEGEYVELFPVTLVSQSFWCHVARSPALISHLHFRVLGEEGSEAEVCYLDYELSFLFIYFTN